MGIPLSGSKVKLIFKLLLLGIFLGLYHRHLLSLFNKSTASMTYPKSNEFERIFYTAHSINREEDGYNLTFNFCNTLFQSLRSISNPYIFVTGRKDSNQRRHKKDTIHYPQVLGKRVKILPIFLLNISIAILFALKQL